MEIAVYHYTGLTLKIEIFVELLEYIAGKGENAGFQHFLVFPHCYQKFTKSGFCKVGIVWYRLGSCYF